jgi:hypothetical protein
VDDLTISGHFDLKQSGFEATVEQILSEHGFVKHPTKVEYGRLSKGAAITKITVRDGHPDVRKEYLAELDRQLSAANDLANGREFHGLYFTRNQIAGRIRFVCWINPNRRKRLLQKFNSISWSKVAKEAASRGLVAAKKRLVAARRVP